MGEPSADYSLRILWSLARWIEDTLGREVLEEVAGKAGVRAEDFDGSTRWVSHEQLETILSETLTLAGDEQTLVKAFEHRFPESFGAFRFMIWGVSQQRRNELAVKMSERVATRVGRFEVMHSEPNLFAFRYRSDRPESRLLCLSRQVPWRIGPTVWGLPPAQLVERACIARGDEYCEYHQRSYTGQSFVPTLLGIAGGALATAILYSTRSLGLAFALPPLFGALVGYLIELRRSSTANLQVAREMNEALRELGEAEADTRSELVALHQRQREWLRVVEDQSAERTHALERIVEGLDDLQRSRTTTIRGFSHDLRNPLFVLKGNAQFLLDQSRNPDETDALRDIESATEQIERMLTMLMEVANVDPASLRLAPQRLQVASLADTLRRRLRALVHGRDIKVSVFTTREAPDVVHVDRTILDRVVDNLLTNASKYTERGSIVLEVGGTPEPADGSVPEGYLTLKLSDTGVGIAEERLAAVFHPRPTSEASTPHSYGVGLSSVVMLMAQIGGRLDVMSKPGVGTTFWAHIPVKAREKVHTSIKDESMENIIKRVVTIRKIVQA